MMFWRPVATGVRVAIKVQPKSRRPGLHGVAAAAGEDGAAGRLRIAVAEPAEGGRANQATCATLARALDVSTGAISVVAGATSRDKTLLVAGDPETLVARLAAL